MLYIFDAGPDLLVRKAAILRDRFRPVFQQPTQPRGIREDQSLEFVLVRGWDERPYWAPPFVMMIGSSPSCSR